MTTTDLCLHPLPREAEGIAPPRQMTYPFCYEPHALCLAAAEEVRRELARHPQWEEEAQEGKMLGVLIVERNATQTSPDGAPYRGFLAAFSGTLCGRGTLPYFVPPVFDVHGTYFEEEERRISQMEPGEERKHRSQALQEWLFGQYHFLNARGEQRPLTQLFAPATPPSGSGECCAPKLLQYAYAHGLRPLCMGEFWVGRRPRGEVREEGRFYPACQHKCKPILTWMLQGLDVEPNPLMKDYGKLVDQLRFVYEDADIVVVDKPSGLLSVPGKDDLPTVRDIILRRHPEASGPIIVHRLDMDTSGLMVAALHEEAYHGLQQQFISHIVKKRYTALLEYSMEEGEEGRIDLRICPNPYDRPRQMVHEEYGRRSITRYRVEGNREGHAVVRLWPETGRTHQLRLHAAAREGLGNPIVGDRLYGTPATRLMLVADTLRFLHPRTGQEMEFSL